MKKYIRPISRLIVLDVKDALMNNVSTQSLEDLDGLYNASELDGEVEADARVTSKSLWDTVW